MGLLALGTRSTLSLGCRFDQKERFGWLRAVVGFYRDTPEWYGYDSYLRLPFCLLTFVLITKEPPAKYSTSKIPLLSASFVNSCTALPHSVIMVWFKPVTGRMG